MMITEVLITWLFLFPFATIEQSNLLSYEKFYGVEVEMPTSGVIESQFLRLWGSIPLKRTINRAEDCAILVTQIKEKTRFLFCGNGEKIIN